MDRDSMTYDEVAEDRDALAAECAKVASEYTAYWEWAQARIRELEAGLRLYGSHHTPCPKSPHHDGYDFNQRCTCGLDDTLDRTGDP